MLERPLDFPESLNEQLKKKDYLGEKENRGFRSYGVSLERDK